MTYKIYTLGCKVNEYESEVMKDILNNNGYYESSEPDICIINTCTVTNQADSKSRKLYRLYALISYLGISVLFFTIKFKNFIKRWFYENDKGKAYSCLWVF